MQILRHRKLENGSYELVVWTDERRSVNGEPDPDYLRTFSYAALAPEDPDPGEKQSKKAKPPMSEDVYVQMQLEEAKLVIEAEKAAESGAEEGQALPSEGQKL